MSRPDEVEAPDYSWRVNPTADSHFAWLRTKFAIDRTFMAWLRTSVAMIGFGFTIVQFFSSFSKLEGVRPVAIPHASFLLGLTLIGAGTISLGIALAQYIQTLHHLESPDFTAIADRKHHLNAAIWLGGAVIMIGVAAFIAVVRRGVLEGGG